jgi:hypothetical protein
MALTMLGLSAGVAAVASVNPCPRLISAAGAGAAAVSLENPNSVTPPGRITYAIASLVSSGLIVVVGHFLHFDFIAIVFAGMFIGRNIGWWLSKAMLYGGPLPVTIVLCLAWGALFAFALHFLIQEFEPGIIAKVIAYGAGAYVSVPNFGLFAPGSIPARAQDRDFLIQVVPPQVQTSRPPGQAARGEASAFTHQPVVSITLFAPRNYSTSFRRPTNLASFGTRTFESLGFTAAW